MPELKAYHNYFLWDYVPSLPTAIVATILFCITTGAVLWRSITTRTRFAIPFIVGGFFQIIGYIARAASYEQTDNLGLYCIQSIFILVAPALFAASIYMTLGRVTRSIRGERHSLIRPRWLTRIFVSGDVCSFLVQGTGGGLMAMDSFSKTAAQNIILAGLAVQIVLFGLFCATAVVFHVRQRRWPSAESSSDNSRWERTLCMLYGTSALIMVRSIFRVVEYVMGHDGYPLQHEWTLYVFDALLMVLAMVVFAWWYPGQLNVPRGGEEDGMSPGEGSVRLESSGYASEERQK